MCLEIDSYWATGLAAAWAVSKAGETAVLRADYWDVELAERTGDSLVDLWVASWASLRAECSAVRWVGQTAEKM
jgi:hypothetical protein